MWAWLVVPENGFIVLHLIGNDNYFNGRYLMMSLYSILLLLYEYNNGVCTTNCPYTPRHPEFNMELTDQVTRSPLSDSPLPPWGDGVEWGQHC